jgi:PKD repeat protein
MHRGKTRRTVWSPKYFVAVAAVLLITTVFASPAEAAPPQGPTVVFTASPNSGAAPLVVSFDPSQSTDNVASIVSWRLSFGDLTLDVTGTGPPALAIPQTYSNVGTYTALLILTDSNTSKASGTTQIIVGEPGGLTSSIKISVEGSPLTNVSSSALVLTPSFTAADTDYVWYCSNGTNNVTLKLESMGTITADGQTGGSLSIPLSLVNNQVVVVTAPGGTNYWIRCLPSTFPKFSVRGNSAATPGYYLTGSFQNLTAGVIGYPIVLNSYGTPVWYLNGITGSGEDVELLPGTHTITWTNGYHYLYNLDTRTVSTLCRPFRRQTPMNYSKTRAGTDG